MTSRLSHRAGPGSFGQAIPALGEPQSRPGDPRFVTGLSQPSSLPIAYAGVLDSLSSDRTYSLATRPPPLPYVPAAARLSRPGEAEISSDISIANPADIPAEVTVTFLEQDKDNTDAPSVTPVLSPRQTRQLDNMPAALFGFSGASSAEGVLVFERISASSPTTPGTVTQQVDPIGSDGFFSRGFLLGLRQDSAFRSEVGIFTPPGSNVPAGTPISAGVARSRAPRGARSSTAV